MWPSPVLQLQAEGTRKGLQDPASRRECLEAPEWTEVASWSTALPSAAATEVERKLGKARGPPDYHPEFKALANGATEGTDPAGARPRRQMHQMQYGFGRFLKHHARRTVSSAAILQELATHA